MTAVLPAHAETGLNLESVSSLFIRAARENADRIALEAQDGTLTYRELEMRASRLAGYLRSFGIGRESLVALCLERSANFITAMLGSLLAGAAYAPLDTSHPTERLHSIIAESKADFLLVDGPNAARFGGLNVPTLTLGESAWLRLEAVKRAIAYPDPHDLAYVVYTSGSTGTPKGCELEHWTLAHVTRWQVGRSEIQPGDRCLQFVAQGFDILQMETWPALITGAAVVVVDEEARLDPRLLRNRMVEKQITSAFLPTPVAERLLHLEWPGLPHAPPGHGRRGASFVPEAGSAVQVRQRVRPRGVLGRVHVHASRARSESDAAAADRPSGRWGAHAHRRRRTAARSLPGERGEMWIAGANVGRGYRHRPDLTAEKFSLDPFCSDGTRLYKSGDIVRWSDRGDLDFLGRIDDQVKVHGHRIEPQEISLTIGTFPEIEQVYVQARRENEIDLRLVAYVVPAPGADLDIRRLRARLAELLPPYMMPAAWVVMASLPLTAHGKVDARALPDPALASDLEPEAEELEEAADDSSPVAALVSEIAVQALGIRRIWPNDNFFDLGGHSLFAALLASRIEEETGIEVAVREVFECPTTASLSAAVEARILAAMGEEPGGARAS